MDYLFAPMEGITGYVFRNAHHRHFHGIKAYYTPFISPNQTRKLTPRELNDVIPEHNEGVPVIPQILTNKAEDFLWAAGRLKELGYTEANLNLGCPSGTVVAKKRGSGFLEYPMELDEFLYQVCDGLTKMEMELSIKTRIGKEKPEEFEELLSIYNRYPLKNLIVHPRVQADYYKNHPHMEAFDLAVQESGNPVFYNGDLFRRAEIGTFGQKYPEVSAVMLGRGFLTNPALAEDSGIAGDSDPNIAENSDSGIAEEKAAFVSHLTTDRIRAFHEDVLEGYRQAIPGDKNVLFKMKELWTYLGEAFEDSAKPMKKIRKAQRMEEYRAAVESLLTEKPICREPAFSGWNK